MSPEIKIAYYRKSDWDKFMRSIVDRDTMHNTWEEWNQDYNKAKKNLKDEGCVVHEMIIDIDELNLYCIERGVMNDGRARSQYVAQLPLSQKKK